MIQYRPFRNPDLPGLVAVWNDAFSDRAAVHFPCWTPFEEHVLAKTYFDPAGLIVADDEGRLVGFSHGGFGPDAALATLSRDRGLVCMLAVIPSHRRRGVGSELLRHSIRYLTAAGRGTIGVGDVRGNPFYHGLYGGSVCTGVLAGDGSVRQFLTFHDFKSDVGFDVFHRRLAGSVGVGDGRFGELRRLYEFRVESRKGIRSWWEECVMGPVELHDFLLEEKATGQPAARATVWEMSGFGQRWNESAAGLIEIEVRPELRRRGLARFLLTQTFRYLQDQFFTVVEAQVRQDDVAGGGLFRGVGCHAIDSSQVYRLAVSS